jgi:hypothetical protein
MAKRKMTFCGDDSKPFWRAVWGYYDMGEKKNPMPAEERFDVLYRYGCRAQQIEEELADLRSGGRGEASPRVVAVPVPR